MIAHQYPVTQVVEEINADHDDNPSPTSHTVIVNEHSPSPSLSPPPRIDRSKSHSRRNGIPRPSNPYFVYRSEQWEKRKDSYPPGMNSKEFSKIAGPEWKALPEEEKSVYRELARVQKREHEEKYPEYQYRPKPKQKTRKNARLRAKRSNSRGDAAAVSPSASSTLSSPSSRSSPSPSFSSSVKAEFKQECDDEALAQLQQPLYLDQPAVTAADVIDNPDYYMDGHCLLPGDMTFTGAMPMPTDQSEFSWDHLPYMQAGFKPAQELASLEMNEMNEILMNQNHMDYGYTNMAPFAPSSSMDLFQFGFGCPLDLQADLGFITLSQARGLDLDQDQVQEPELDFVISSSLSSASSPLSFSSTSSSSSSSSSPVGTGTGSSHAGSFTGTGTGTGSATVDDVRSRSIVGTGTGTGIGIGTRNVDIETKTETETGTSTSTSTTDTDTDIYASAYDDSDPNFFLDNDFDNFTRFGGFGGFGGFGDGGLGGVDVGVDGGVGVGVWE
ncbi:hypothetical protein D9758_000007 [Tetrapyrgos nigripes]|uniref:HMG box domain-containing protein n=1 Tax=Tetrapyrgos nigripes TaxID=182062 RepID=A0A8H5H1Z5_9AGAR|nr:hypothetical protein D9758_000007 [Tetrapyrgos nigripes]